MENNKQYQKNPDEIGCLWTKTSAKGTKYFSGVLELVDTGKINIVIFSNANKKSEKAPTHIILKSKPREEIKKAELPTIEIKEEEINPLDLPF